MESNIIIGLIVIILLILYLVHQQSQPKVVVVLFYAEWCPACRGFLPTWQQLKDNIPEGVKLVEVNEKDKEHMAQKEKELGTQVASFPWIVVSSSKGTERYTGPRDFQSMMDYLSRMN